jgi:tetratricopeptide (TPR) repeat protein
MSFWKKKGEDKLSNPFKKMLDDREITRIESILNEFELIKIKRPAPSSIGNLSIYMNEHGVKDGKSHPELMEIAANIQKLADTNQDVKSEIVKTLIYTFGVTIYRLALSRIIDAQAINTASTYLEFAVKIDPNYYQAYNRLGDTWIWIPEDQVEAIRCYKTSLHYHGQGRSSTAMFVGGGDKRFKGDNYFKIGICLSRINRVADAILFIRYAQDFIEDDDDMYTELGFENWVEVYKNVESMR